METNTDSTATRFPLGATVRMSGYSLESSRQYWLIQGDRMRQDRAHESYLSKVAKRGTVTAHLPGQYGSAIEVAWADGTKSQGLDYMFALA